MATPDYYKNQYLASQRAKIINEETLIQMIKFADDNYSRDDTSCRFEVAYSYYAIAEYFENAEAFRNASKYYHFAAHQLRSVENFKNAAGAYFKGGRTAEAAALTKGEPENRKIENLDWAVRSYARAKTCFEDIGDAEEASEAYVAEQNARRKLAKARGNLSSWLALELLRVTTKYGQKWGRLLITMAGFIVLYASTYETLHRHHQLGVSIEGHWNTFSAIYYPLAVALSLDAGAFSDSTIVAQWIGLSNVVLAWIFLGVAGALVARRVKER